MVYIESKETRELKSTIAKGKIRDEKGHFLNAQSQNPIGDNQDDLLDVHVGNPLRKITQLLQDIKNQKVFSFTFKGSLGIMGVVLTLSVFGLLGAGNILCEKGEQTQIGTIKLLQMQDVDSSTIPFIGNLLDYFSPKMSHKRMVLIKPNQEVLILPFSRDIALTQFVNSYVLATGTYNACSSTLSIKNPKAIELYTK